MTMRWPLGTRTGAEFNFTSGKDVWRAGTPKLRRFLERRKPVSGIIVLSAGIWPLKSEPTSFMVTQDARQ